ncbi:Endonuclease-reverse transcriptase HmRTE-e01, partial [Scophthalmus maximus]
MDRLADEVRQTSPWTVMYTDDTDEICSESGEKVEASLGGGGGVHQRVVNELENAGV